MDLSDQLELSVLIKWIETYAVESPEHTVQMIYEMKRIIEHYSQEQPENIINIRGWKNAR